MRVAGKILAEVLAAVRLAAQEGVSLQALDRTANRMITQAGAKPSFLGYHPAWAKKSYPATLCLSLNEVIVHGVPTARLLKLGDLLKIDAGVCYKDYHADAAITVSVGPASPEARRLMEITYEALNAGIHAARTGATVGDIGQAISGYVLGHGLRVAEDLTGHGIGQELHEDPSVPNIGLAGRGLALKAGMTLAIEPMVVLGTSKIRQLPDDSYATFDGSLAAHFEHTILITKDGAEILTALT